MTFKKINFDEITCNPYSLFGKSWSLLTAGTIDQYNTMTISWGQLGSLWGKPVCSVYVRPQRYTKQFVDNNDYFTLCFFDDCFHQDLVYLGNNSGRDEDKVAKTKLTPIALGPSVAFKEAKLVLLIRKLYQAPIEKNYFFIQKYLKLYIL